MIEFEVINSFAWKKFGGNPAGVVFDRGVLSDELRQAVARQLNLVETVFIGKAAGPEADCELRFFTPEKELPIAGHPTIAAWTAMLDRESPAARKELYRQSTRKGIQEIRVVRGAGSPEIRMRQPQPVFREIAESAGELAGVFGLEAGDIEPGLPPYAVDTGLGHIIFCVKGLACCMRVRRNIPALKALCLRYAVNEAQLFCFETMERGNDLHTRNICPREGIEDPACGVGNGALAAYLLRLKHPAGVPLAIKAEQGVVVNMPSLIKCHGIRTVNGDYEIFIGGSGIRMIRGEMLI